MPAAARPWTFTLLLLGVAAVAGGVVFAALNAGAGAVSMASVDIWLLALTVGVTTGVVIDARRNPAPPPATPPPPAGEPR